MNSIITDLTCYRFLDLLQWHKVLPYGILRATLPPLGQIKSARHDDIK